MTLIEIICYVIVPGMCMVMFPSIVILITFCFKIATKVTKLESDYAHLNTSVDTKFNEFHAQLTSMSADIKLLLEFANVQKGQSTKCKLDTEG